MRDLDLLMRIKKLEQNFNKLAEGEGINNVWQELDKLTDIVANQGDEIVLQRKIILLMKDWMHLQMEQEDDVA